MENQGQTPNPHQAEASKRVHKEVKEPAGGQTKSHLAEDSIHPRFVSALKHLLWMTLTLMALGAFVRTMKAGLACPDWPLCFGKVIPDWHFGVWLEFLHRVEAAIVALVFLGCLIYALRSKAVPLATKRAGVVAAILLFLQIAMGGLTVLWLVKTYVVTTHLMLATLFFSAVLWMYMTARPAVVAPSTPVPSWLSQWAIVIAGLVLAQIFIGGLVASTYSGSVCVDWPLCNGQWVPTWSGAIGLQVTHRFFAYGLAVLIFALGTVAHFRRREPWMTDQLKYLILSNMALVCLQIAVGVANLMLLIPAWLTVLHQSLAVVLLAVNLRLFFVARRASKCGSSAPSLASENAPAFEKTYA